MKSPAPISSSSDSATWATTRPLRRRKCPLPPTTDAASLLSAGARSAWLARSAGTRPKPTPVSTESPSVKSPTRQSGAAESVRAASWKGSARISASPTQYASCRPTRPPASESVTLSTSCRRTRRMRLAPSARRTAVSFSRAEARVSSRLATLAHAISSTRPTMPISTTSGVPDWSRRPDVPRPPGSSSSDFLRKRVRRLSDAALEVRQVLLEQLRVDDVRRGARLGQRDPVLQARHAHEPARTPLAEALAPGGLHLLLHRDRHVDVDRRAHLDAVEAGRGDADDRHRVAVDADRLADDLRVAAEAALEEAVTQDDDGMGRGCAVVLRA